MKNLGLATTTAEKLREAYGRGTTDYISYTSHIMPGIPSDDASAIIAVALDNCDRDKELTLCKRMPSCENNSIILAGDFTHMLKAVIAQPDNNILLVANQTQLRCTSYRYLALTNPTCNPIVYTEDGKCLGAMCKIDFKKGFMQCIKSNRYIKHCIADGCYLFSLTTAGQRALWDEQRCILDEPPQPVIESDITLVTKEF